jgi:hypothetical protein
MNRFLVKKHKDTKALKVLAKIHQDQGKAEGELSEIQTALRRPVGQNIWQTLKYLFSKSVLPRFNSHRGIKLIHLQALRAIKSFRILIGIGLTLVVRGVGSSVIV